MKRTLRPAFIIAVTLFVTGQAHLSRRLPDGTRNADILAALTSRVDAGKNTGMVVGTIDADGSTSRAAYGESHRRTEKGRITQENGRRGGPCANHTREREKGGPCANHTREREKGGHRSGTATLALTR